MSAADWGIGGGGGGLIFISGPKCPPILSITDTES